MAKSRLQRAMEAEYEFTPRERDGYFTLTVKNACIFFTNFAGEPSDRNFNSTERTFKLSLPEDIAHRLLNDGWNVWIKEPAAEGDDPTYSIDVKVKFREEYPNARGALIYFYSEFNGQRTKIQLNKDTVGQLDDEQLMHVSLTISPYHSDKAKKYYWNASLLEMHAIAAPARNSNLNGYFDNWLNEPMR